MLEAQAKAGVDYAGELSAEVTDAIMKKWSKIGEKIYFLLLIPFILCFNFNRKNRVFCQTCVFYH